MTPSPQPESPEPLKVVAWRFSSDRSTVTDVTDNGARVSSLRKYPRAVIEDMVLKSEAEAALAAKDAEIKRLIKERDDARRAKTGHFSPAYLLTNARRIAAPEYALMPNWALATQVFAVGSTTANAICRENGIDPDAKSVHPGDTIGCKVTRFDAQTAIAKLKEKA